MREVVFDQSTFKEAFELDLNSARAFVLIQSPFISHAGVERISQSLKLLRTRGVRTCIYIQEPREWNERQGLPEPEQTKIQQLEDVLKTLKSLGVHASLRKRIHEKIAVIDGSLLWDGSLNILSYNPKATLERMTRTVDVAKALGAIVRHQLDSCPHCVSQATTQISPDLRVRGESIGSLIATRRISKGLTQSQFAQLAGVHRPNLSRIESGHCLSPELETLTRIFQALGGELAFLPAHALPFVEFYLRLTTEEK